MAAVAGMLTVPGAADAATANERAEANMVRAINGARANHGLSALRSSSSLMGSAGRYSHWLMANDTFGHGSSIRASSEFVALGEALAMHTGHRFRARATVSRWLGSPSHRAIVLSRSMRWLGVGVTRGRMGAARATVWVLHVGKLGSSAPELPAIRLP